MKTSSEDTAETAPIESIIDHESLRNRDDIPFHEETDLVDGETLELVENLDDMAPVGVTNDEGEVLLMRVDEDCAWKIPSPSVGPSEDYAEVARRWVTEQAHLTIVLDAVEGVWCYAARLENEDHEATRNFVVFSASPVTDGTAMDDSNTDTPEENTATAVGWFDELPADAEEPPGTRLFFD